MDRTARTLSGGEAQRVRLATQIGSGLTGVLYVCDEPTVGLHPHDDHLLIATLSNLRDMGNTVVVVEHDEAMMRAADFIVDMGPGAGEHGGNVVVTGSIDEIMDSDESITGHYLSGRKRVPTPETRRPGNGGSLTVKGARENNLKNVNECVPNVQQSDVLVVLLSSDVLTRPWCVLEILAAIKSDIPIVTVDVTPRRRAPPWGSCFASACPAPSRSRARRCVPAPTSPPGCSCPPCRPRHACRRASL